MHITLDHLAVVAPTLAEGKAYVFDCLGIEVPFGGEHPNMGTHNCLAKLGDDEFLEIIAVNPDAPAPPRARWFNLDKHGSRAPYLAHWIARTSDLQTCLTKVPGEVGEPIDCMRGKLRWQLTVPNDGSFAFDGLYPSIIQWPYTPFPGSSMTDVGCSIDTLELSHPATDELSTALEAVLSDDRIRVKRNSDPKMHARINIPSGIKVLG